MNNAGFAKFWAFDKYIYLNTTLIITFEDISGSDFAVELYKRVLGKDIPKEKCTLVKLLFVNGETFYVSNDYKQVQRLVGVDGIYDL